MYKLKPSKLRKALAKAIKQEKRIVENLRVIAPNSEELAQHEGDLAKLRKALHDVQIKGGVG